MAANQGYRSKIRINGVVYIASKWNVRVTCGDLDISNFEGQRGDGIIPGAAAVPPAFLPEEFETRTSGLVVAEITIEKASFDPTDNPFAAPISINTTFRPAILIFLNAGGLAWSFPRVLVTVNDAGGDVAGLQPVSFTAKSDGPFFFPAVGAAAARVG